MLGKTPTRPSLLQARELTDASLLGASAADLRRSRKKCVYPDLESMLEVQLEPLDRVLLREHDPDIMLAVRNAFDRRPTVAWTPA
jgi:hypothetical protein